MGSDKFNFHIMKYPSCSDSGNKFIGRIPKHWDIRKLGYVGVFSASGINKKDFEDEVPVRMVNYTDVYGNNSSEIWGHYDLMHTTAPKAKSIEHSLREGDILFTPSSETADEIAISAVVMENLPGVVYSYHLIRLRPQISLDKNFSKYFCKNSNILEQFSSICKGTTRQILTRDNFKNIQVVIPPFSEQRAIANFLDHHTAKIDALIEKQERLIELLEEKRNALIAHAVTKGVDPDVPMKDSGVEWLGEIPEHWKTRKAKWLFKETKDKNHPEETLLSVTQDNSVISREESEINVWNPGDDVSGYKLIKPGQFVISLRSFQGGIEYSRIRGIVSPAYVVMKPLVPQYNEFFRYLLKSDPAISALENLTSGIRQGKNINFNDFILLDCPLPPLSEANRIVNHLNNELEKINKLVNQVKDLLEKIHEYRSSLISSAVTGKIDIRHWQEKEVVDLE